MKRFHAEFVTSLTSAFADIAGMWRHDDKSDVIPEHLRLEGIEVIQSARQECVYLGLRTPIATADRLLDALKRDDCTIGTQTTLLDALCSRIVDELQFEFFLALSPAEADRYENWQKGWGAILDRCPEIIRDVEEMNKCFSLARYTAAIFHSMQVAEWGAIKLGNHIGVTDPRKGWGATEKRLKLLVNGGHAGLPSDLTGQFPFLEQMHREIDSLVLAWRHKVDHAANHLAIVPNTDFTPDIAEHIIGAVRIFMLRLIEGTPPQVV